MGISANGQKDGDDGADLRRNARDTLAGCKTRWDGFRQEVGGALNGHMARSFAYLTNVLDEKSTPRDWIKDGFALWIRCCGTGRDLYKATSKLYCPPDSTD